MTTFDTSCIISNLYEYINIMTDTHTQYAYRDTEQRLEGYVAKTGQSSLPYVY